jgi:hypothetical protein
MSEAAPTIGKVPSLFRNYVSFIGAAIVCACLASILLLFLIELTGSTDNPYLGILTYVILPSILIFGLFVILLGMLWERRRRRKVAPAEVMPYPVLDFNDPRRRRAFFVFLTLSFFFISLSAFGSYRAYEHSESVAFCGQTCHTVMKPEFVAFQASPHARLRCVDCHVGGGAEWYVRSKFSGVRQLYKVIFNKYPRPITTPVHNMRPANDTCAQCHWPERFYGDQLKVFNRYAYDEQNTLRQTRMLVHVGGGSPAAGPVTGIHWHMNLANEITFVATDRQRQVIPWIRVKDREGNVTEYFDKNRPLTPEQIARSPQRRMDCIDCHNRPAHIYVPPDAAVDEALAAGKLDGSLPFLKRQAVAVLSQPYATNDEALRSIANGLEQFYRTNYADLSAQKGAAVKGAVSEVQRIYQTYFFPEMKTDWQTHPNNIGHFYSAGCSRCHDGEHVSNTGRTISNDCNTCHQVLDQSAANRAAFDGSFRHPVALGELAKLSCDTCHHANKPFQHPVNLGDISQFKCVDCHAGKVWARPAT